MEKFKNLLKKTVEDQLSGFIILGAITVTVAVVIGIFSLMKYNQTVNVNAQNSDNKTQEEIVEQNVESVENLENVASINSVEELQKLNEKEMEEAKKKEETKKEQKSTPAYYIKVNYKAQVVTIYGKDSKGKYTKPVKAMVCSTGTYTPTSGVYKTPNRFRWLHMIGDVYAQYCTQIVGDILFHSVPYLKNGDHSSLEYWAYDQLGKRVSMGCVRLTCKDAKWIYDNCQLGTQVEFYSSSNPGPLGKPSAKKISSAPANIRGWDPTDPVANNPWKDYLKEQEKKKKEETTQKTETTNKEENKTQNTVQKPQNSIPSQDTNTKVEVNDNIIKNEQTDKDDDETTKPDTDEKQDDLKEENKDVLVNEVNIISNELDVNTI